MSNGIYTISVTCRMGLKVLFAVTGHKYVTRSRGMSPMSIILILSYGVKKMINSFVLHD